jgi:hypothetical protein
MKRPSRKRQSSFWLTGTCAWCLLAVAGVGVAFLCVPSENRYPAALVGASVFFLVQWFLPACRPVPGKRLCPWNWALFVFFLQLVLLPFSLLLFGPSRGVLPFLPSDLAINLAILVNAAAFVAFCGTYQYFARRPADDPETSTVKRARSAPSFGYIVFSGIVGLLGFFFAFGGLDKVAEYFADPAGYLSRLAADSDKLILAAGLFLRPFFGIFVVMLWCRWLERVTSRKIRGFATVVTVLAIVAVCFSNATFNYNRGSVVVPLIAMLAVLLNDQRRLPRRTVFAAGMIVLVVLLLAPFYGAYRSSNFTGEEILSDQSVRSVLSNKIELVDMLQVYGGAPQFLGFFLEMDKWGANPRWGKILGSSALAPLPILGKPFRDGSGTAIYNRFIYGMLDVEDQIAPFQGETFLDFHLPGMLAAFALLGWLTFKLQIAFARSKSFFELFVWQYFAVWVCFLIIGSLSVVSQIFIYFCWPFFLFFVWRRLNIRFTGRFSVRMVTGAASSTRTGLA